MRGGECQACPAGFKCAGTSVVEPERDDSGQVSHWLGLPLTLTLTLTLTLIGQVSHWLAARDTPGSLRAAVTLHGLEFAHFGGGDIAEGVKAATP